METKFCKVCNIEKPYSEFHKMSGCIGGVRTVCKECRKIEKVEYHSRPKVKERIKQHYQDNKEVFRKRMNIHYWTLNGQYHNYKKRAKKGNLEFCLTEEDCAPFYKTNCYYCNDNLKGLGIDRLNNSKGYIKDNIVPCCSTCNFMKHILNKDEFINHILKINKNLKLNNC